MMHATYYAVVADATSAGYTAYKVYADSALAVTKAFVRAGYKHYLSMPAHEMREWDYEQWEVANKPSPVRLKENLDLRKALEAQKLMGAALAKSKKRKKSKKPAQPPHPMPHFPRSTRTGQKPKR